jgi:hypothetical protein
MQTLEMKGTAATPGVLFDGHTGSLQITGRALADDADRFFEPAMSWLREYSKAPKASTQLSFKLDYLNPESSKVILDILTLVEKLPGARVYWNFRNGDEDMEETGEEFAELVGVPFEFKTY